MTPADWLQHAEDRWHALNTGRQIGTLALLVMGAIVLIQSAIS